MKLMEYEGKEIFSKYGVSVPKGFVISSTKELKKNLIKIRGDVVLKSQVLTGHRGKLGGIVSSSQEFAETEAKKLFEKEIKGMIPKKILVEEKLSVDDELYISLAVDRKHKGIMLLFSFEGGVDIEELAEKNPDKIIKFPFFELSSENIAKISSLISNFKAKENILELITKLYKIMKEKDATIVEINPLVVSDNKLVAADSKIIIDDNALFRQKLKTKFEGTEIEKKAKKLGLGYVELDGNIAVIGNGAGMVMATLDLISLYGGKPANFLDVGAGSGEDVMEKAMEICMMKKPGGILINIFAGLTSCKEVAKGIIDYKKKFGIKIPMVVRITGIDEEAGKKILDKDGIHSISTMEEAVKKIISTVK